MRPALTLLLILLGGIRPSWGEVPHPSLRFAAPVSLSAVRISALPCPSGEGKCLSADLAVAHRAGARLLHEGASYLLDAVGAEHIALDFGEYAEVALREIQNGVERGLAEQAELREPGQRCLRRLLRRHVHYEVLPHVSLPMEIELAVSKLADRFHRLARQPLVITSGPRTPESQAAAMYLKLILGGSGALRRQYRKTEAAAEIKKTYDQARNKRQRRASIVAAMAATIRKQMAEGIYLSPHLKGAAVDLRSRGLGKKGRWALQKAVAAFKGMRLIQEEKIPPHFHLEINGEEPSSQPAASSTTTAKSPAAAKTPAAVTKARPPAR